MAAMEVPEWAVRLAEQCGVYLALFAAGAALVKAVPRPPAADKSIRAEAVRALLFGRGGDARRGGEEPAARQPGAGKFLFCAAGLLVSYVSWGVLQEQLVAREYGSGRLESSTFLVFCNRAAAVLVAGAIAARGEGGLRMSAPLYLFSVVSLTNVLSSWCQLEALRHVNFPTQVLAKSSKIIPIMAVGRLLLAKRYEWFEYAVAAVICTGTTIFVLSQNKGKTEAAGAPAASLSGVVLLALYLLFDSSTSHFQSFLFAKHKLSPYQMMFGINLFSASFTLASLVQSGELAPSLSFLRANPECALHIALFSAAGVVGQSFIFYTIKELGAVVFTMIMTSRMIVSILLSCLLFGHAVNAEGVVGACLVFAALGFQVFCKVRASKQKAA